MRPPFTMYLNTIKQRKNLFLFFCFFLTMDTLNSQNLLQSLSIEEANLYKDIEEISWQGELQSAKKWIDSLGSNLLFISKYNDLESNRRVIFAKHYVGEVGSYSLLWKLMDFVDTDWLGDGEPRLQLVVVDDEDMNGVAETYIGYTLFPDVTDCCYPSELKVIVHEGISKYAIRGMTEVVWNGVSEGGTKNLSGQNSIENASVEIQKRSNKIYDHIYKKTFIRWQSSTE